jgi:signal transduction histidine kinase
MRNYFRLAQAQERLVRWAPPQVRPNISDVLEADRARLARDLHAGTGQALAGIKIHLELIGTLLEDPPAKVRASLERIGLLVQEALDHTRSLTRRGYPPAWESVQLAAAVEHLWETTGIPLKFEAVLEIGVFPEEPPHAVRVLIYRATQEILANVIRHARATRVALRLWRAGDRIWLRVEDNGCGFDAAAVLAGQSHAGIGVRSMRDQVYDFGGEFAIESGAGGTAVSIALPETE